MLITFCDRLENKLLIKYLEKKDKSIDTILFGKSGKLDSLGLVNLIITIKQKIEEKLCTAITTANERAMPQKIVRLEQFVLLTKIGILKEALHESY